ncbi:hypothetical protein KRP22_001051 [Phytophthora ramorum]|nr:Cilia- and flagella-associated protein 54 [Phytophthora ramorum]
MTKKGGERSRIQSERATKDSALDGGEVVVDQFTREFAALLQLTREKHAKQLTTESFGGIRDDATNSRQEVAFFGDITQKLVPLVDKLMQATPDQISTAKKVELLLVFGDKFYHVQEFQAASVFFYEKVLVLDEMLQNSTTNSSHHGVLGRILSATASTTPKRSRLEGQAYVRSLFGAAMSCFHIQKRSDRFVKHPGRLEKMMEALTFLRLGMETTVAMERQYSGQFSWLTLNGSVLLYSIAKPLQALGFSREVVAYLKWSLLAMESAVALSTTKYLMWRLQLGSAICDCYDDLALKEAVKAHQHTKSAVACAAYLQQAVQRLRKEEELDMPLPGDVQRTLAQAETSSAMLVARANASAAHQPLTRNMIAAAFPAVSDQMRAAIDALESISREAKQKRGRQGPTILVSTASPPPTHEALSELFAFVMDIAATLLQPLVEAEDPSASKPDLAIFPLSFHLLAIRHCWELAKPNEQMSLLIKSARTRLKISEDIVAADASVVSCLLVLYETLHEVQQTWSAWEAMSEDERVQLSSNPRLRLTVTGSTIPASKILTRLSKAVQNCVLHGDGAIPRTNPELMTSVALQIWREFVLPMLKELDATEPSQFSKPLKRVLYYMIFAKPAGAGTAVSTNSNLLAGTASPVYPPRLHVTISGLLPNESYVFAVAAFDSKHELIHSIGETSEPVVALNPLPLAMCYGYLAKACYDVQLATRANKAATYLYNAVVSHDCDGRPSWMANPFYRQALKRDAVARFPVPILNLCIQALLILCHNEPGDLERDGKLVTSSDLDAHSLAGTQTKALEDSRKIAMAIEIACATDNQEAIHVLCFKGYRFLLPLLHLKGSCDGITFAALVTFYQALHVIPSEKWDVETRSICARVGYELFRVAQEANSDISRVTLPLVLTERHHKGADQAQSNSIMSNEEDDSLREVVALFKLASNVQSSAPSPDAPAPPTPVVAVASSQGAGAKGGAVAASKGKSQNNTPQATPRTEGDADKGKGEGKLQCLDQLLHAAGNDLSKVFATLEQHSSSDRRAIEFASKVCGAVLGSGTNEVAPFDKFLSSLKVAGAISLQFRETLGALGGESLLPEPREAAQTEEADQEHKSSETPGLETTNLDTVAGADDEYLYRWCGELFFVQSVLLYRKITKLCDTINAVDTAKGPDTEDCTYELLHGDNNAEAEASHTKQNNGSKLAPSESSGDPHEGESMESQEHSAGSDEPLQDNQLDQLFGELLEKSAACCKLFRLANCWQGLQAVSQQLWNAIWLAWVAPSRVSSSSTRLKHLSICIDALLDMMDIAMNGTGDQNTVMSTAATPVSASNPASLEQSMALSTVVYAASNALNIDQTWLARLMAYSLKAFCAFKDWTRIVQNGSRYHVLCGSSVEGSQFSDRNFPILVYAQQQIVSHQEALLKTAEEERNAYIVVFQEQEAKKKKKKSRLVVEEVLSPEEISFRANKQEMERRIQELVTERNVEREKLFDLSKTYDGLTKASNKSHQALNTCHGLVEKYRRLYQRSTNSADGGTMHQHQDELSGLRRQIITSYTRCVILSRQKRQKRIVCQALQEAGDFHLACGDLKAATKSWLETLDNAFSMLHVGSSWREVLTPSADQFLESTSGNTNKDVIAGDELWVGLQCCSVLSKLVMHSSEVNLHEAVDYALMGAAVFTRFYGCSVPHPTKCFMFGSYRMLGQLWPGRKLLGDPDRAFPFSLGVMLVMVPEVLLQYEHQYATTAMPVITGYEYVAQNCLEDSNHVANARRLRVEALVQCGRFHEAFQVVMNLLRGGVTPRSSTGVPELETVVFHDGKSILDESNRAALNWLVAFEAEHTRAELRKHYPAALVGHVLIAILHLAVALASHESRYDRDTAMVRSAAKKMAQAMLTLVKPSEATITLAQTPRNAVEGEVDGDASPQQILHSASWEDLQLHRLRADIHLQLSYIAFYEGEWSTSKASSMDAVGEYNAIPVGNDPPLCLDLDQQLKFSLVLSRGTFLAKCRSQVIACCLAQTHYRAALEAAEAAIKEAKATGEEHLRQHLELQRLQASVFLGEREIAERELFTLREDGLSAHTSVSLSYVHTLQTLSSVLRSKALLSSQPSALIAVCERLSEAEQVLDVSLEHDGWISVSHNEHSSELVKRLSLYRPAIPDFVQVHADLAQALLECPVHLDSESVVAREKRAQRSVDSGLCALDHTTKRMSATRARLLLLKGILLSKALFATTPLFGPNNEANHLLETDEQELKQQFEECAESFVGCIKSSIEGGYDRQLVRLALIELVNLFGQKLIRGSEDVHVQAAFHYLNLALEVQKHESVLFDTLELQNGSVTSVEKLPASICGSINAQPEAASTPSTASSKPPDVAAIVNFFVHLIRMQHALPVSTASLQDMCALLHSFLIQNHSTYSRMACLTDLPSVPTTDPEIRVGMVCALWGQDLAPAIAPGVGETAHNGRLTLYFTLGTTKVSIAEGSSAANNAAAVARMEKFASSPLLSKHSNLDRQFIRRLKTAFSKLRTQMEDEDSFLIDRGTFPKTLQSILYDMQQLFRAPNGAKHLPHSREANQGGTLQETVSTEDLRDAFGNAVSIECTLDTVRRLEDLFSINKGVNVADNDLCYFLRDLLD